MNLERKATDAAENLQRVSGSARTGAINQLILTFLGQNALPYNVVSSTSFRELLPVLEPRYKIPSTWTFAQKLAPARVELYEAGKRREINSLEDFSVCIEFDAWSSHSGQSLLAVVLTRPGGKSSLLDLVDISAVSHTAEFLAGTFVESIKGSIIDPKKINVIISDEAANFKRAREIIAEESDFEHVIEYRCLAHVFNLVGASITKHFSVKKFMDKLINFIDLVSRNKPLATAIAEAGGGRIIRPVPTRWFSTCAAINSVLRIKPVLTNLPDRPELGLDRFGPLLQDHRLWTALEHLKTYFDALSKIIGDSECFDTSIGRAFRSFLEFGNLLFCKLPLSKQFINVVKSSFICYFFPLDLDLVLAAYVLDPNNRVKWLTEEAINRALVRIGLIIMQCKGDDLQSSTGEDSDVAGVDDSFIDACSSEYKKYLAKLKKQNEAIHDVPAFWRRNKDFLIMKQAGLRLALCGSSSANVERIFSALGRICSPLRNRLSVDSMFALLSILVEEPNSKPSGKTRKHVAAQFEPNEEDFGTGELGGVLSELSIMDAESVTEVLEVTDDARMFENTPEHRKFEELIDFSLVVGSGEVVREERRIKTPISVRAQRMADRLLSRRQNN